MDLVGIGFSGAGIVPYAVLYRFGSQHKVTTMRIFPLIALVSLLCNGCAVVAVADAAVTVAATTVKVGAAVVGTTVDVATAGVKAVAGSSDDKK